MENSITTPPKKKLETYLAIVLIVLVTIITYGLLIKSFGFYLDDWYILWGGRAAGPGLIVDFHQFDRPLVSLFDSCTGNACVLPVHGPKRRGC